VRRATARPGTLSQALERLDEITRRLRAECPWDREQDERTIVPHTVEEAYELADAAQRHDDAKLLDELGDVLFQVCFLALLLEERGAGDLAQVAERCVEKLVRRHPHVFGPAEAGTAGADGETGEALAHPRPRTAAEVLRNWDRIKSTEAGREPGLFGEVPENLPGLLYARKLQRRAASGGFDFPDAAAAMDKAHEEVGELAAVAAEGSREERFHEVGDALFALVAVARKLNVDPELALRAAAERFRARVG
jgi:MazG family protein